MAGQRRLTELLLKIFVHFLYIRFIFVVLVIVITSKLVAIILHDAWGSEAPKQIKLAAIF